MLSILIYSELTYAKDFARWKHLNICTTYCTICDHNIVSIFIIIVFPKQNCMLLHECKCPSENQLNHNSICLLSYLKANTSDAIIPNYFLSNCNIPPCKQTWKNDVDVHLHQRHMAVWVCSPIVAESDEPAIIVSCINAKRTTP
jgi:hypothetical protein